ncbi:MAG TPA: transcription termination factor Rho [Acidimicrobiales bacterium]|nr:transcription termination factor Rho [Acidimicrobiales bacterium]
MSEPQLERSVLEAKEREELFAIANALGTSPTSRARKSDLVNQILQATGVEVAETPAEAPKPRRTRARKATAESEAASAGPAQSPLPLEDADGAPRARAATKSTGRSASRSAAAAPAPEPETAEEPAASGEPAATASELGGGLAAARGSMAARANAPETPAAPAKPEAKTDAKSDARAEGGAPTTPAATPAPPAASSARRPAPPARASEARAGERPIPPRPAPGSARPAQEGSRPGGPGRPLAGGPGGGRPPMGAPNGRGPATSGSSNGGQANGNGAPNGSSQSPGNSRGPSAGQAGSGDGRGASAGQAGSGDGRAMAGAGAQNPARAAGGSAGNAAGSQGGGQPGNGGNGNNDHGGHGNDSDGGQAARFEGETGNRRSRRRRGRDRTERGERDLPGQVTEQPFNGEPTAVAGLLDLREEGYGFLRANGYLPGPDDVYVSISQVRRFALRRGDYLEGGSRPAGGNEKYPALLRVDRISGLEPDQARDRPRFEALTPLYPDSRLRLEMPKDAGNLTARIIDLLAPIGKGQRGLIVSPPKAGKTTVLKQIAHSIETNNPEVHLMVLLVDERPEEVTDMRRSVGGEVIASTFDRPADEHIQIAELSIERAKRMVELGKDVVLVLDGITRLARAYNLAQPASGRVMSGGIDTGALYPPKKFFGAARNIEEGGSLTILATALVDTGSRMDEVIFEEFKGTGNMELRLDRRLAERRLYPSIDVGGSSTRHEELLYSKEELQQSWRLRRALTALGGEGNPAAGLELLIDRLKVTRSNADLLAEMAKNPVPGV